MTDQTGRQFFETIITKKKNQNSKEENDISKVIGKLVAQSHGTLSAAPYVTLSSSAVFSPLSHTMENDLPHVLQHFPPIFFFYSEET